MQFCSTRLESQQIPLAISAMHVSADCTFEYCQGGGSSPQRDTPVIAGSTSM